MLYIKGSAYLIVFGALSLGSLHSKAILLKQSAVQEKESFKSEIGLSPKRQKMAIEA